MLIPLHAQRRQQQSRFGLIWRDDRWSWAPVVTQRSPQHAVLLWSYKWCRLLKSQKLVWFTHYFPQVFTKGEFAEIRNMIICLEQNPMKWQSNRSPPMKQNALLQDAVCKVTQSKVNRNNSGYLANSKTHKKNTFSKLYLHTYYLFFYKYI